MKNINEFIYMFSVSEIKIHFFQGSNLNGLLFNLIDSLG